MMLYKGHKVYMNGKYPAVFINGKQKTAKGWTFRKG